MFSCFSEDGKDQIKIFASESLTLTFNCDLKKAEFL